MIPRASLVVSMVVSMVVACGSSNDQPDAAIADAADTADAAPDAPSTTLMFSGVVLDTKTGGGTQPVAGATVTIKERPSITTTTGATGRFTIELIADQTMTVIFDALGHPRTIQRPIVLHASQAGTFQIFLVNQAEFDALNTAGGAATGAGIVAVTVIPVGSCASDGSGVVLSSDPSSGTAKYVTAGAAINPQATSTGTTGSTAYNAVIVGASGTLTGVVVSTPTCAQAPYPQSPKPFFSVEGAVTVVPGALVNTTVFLE